MFVWFLDIGLAYFQPFYNFPAVSFLKEKKNKSHIFFVLDDTLKGDSSVAVVFWSNTQPARSMNNILERILASSTATHCHDMSLPGRQWGVRTLPETPWSRPGYLQWNGILIWTPVLRMFKMFISRQVTSGHRSTLKFPNSIVLMTNVHSVCGLGFLCRNGMAAVG